MKKTKLLSLTLVALMATPIVSCSDDKTQDEPDAPPVVNPVTGGPHTVFTTTDGNKITLASWGNSDDLKRFKYNFENYAVEAGGIKLNYESGKLIYGDGATGEFKLNASGYITNLSYLRSYEDSDYKYDDKEEYTYTYDAQGQIVKIVCKETYFYINKKDGDQTTVTKNDVHSFNWRDGRILTAGEDWTRTEEDRDGQRKVTSIKLEYSVNYGDKKNQLGQFTDSYCHWFGDNDALAFVGLLGKAPSVLPMSMIMNYTVINEDGTTETGGESTDYAYTVDMVGKIQTETVDGDVYVFTYNNLSKLE